MAGRGRGPLRGTLPEAAARGAGLDAAGTPAILPVEDAAGALTPWFITVANIESRDPKKVREGNERVVRPRLSDAAFFYDQDRRRSLADFAAGLDSVTFQAKLGSIGDKSRRIAALAARLAAVAGADPAFVARAAALAKCDLLTRDGRRVSRAAGRDGRLLRSRRRRARRGRHRHARALHAARRRRRAARHAGRHRGRAGRQARHAGRHLRDRPETRGTKDPFGLRRAAIGCLRIVLEHSLDLDLRGVARRGAARHSRCRRRPRPPTCSVFMKERLRAWYLGEGQVDGAAAFTTEMFDAVLAAALGAARFRRAAARAGSLPEAARSREPRRRQQAHRQHPAQVRGRRARHGRCRGAARTRRAGAGRGARRAADEVRRAVDARDYDGALGASRRCGRRSTRSSRT